MVQFTLLTGQNALAQTYAQKLRQLPNDIGGEIYLKKAETFSLLRDDQAIIELAQEANRQSGLISDPVFWHWSAVAYANQDHWQQAKTLWKKAEKEAQIASMVGENLKNLQRTLGERTSPWAFEFSKWVGASTLDDLRQLAEKLSLSDKQALKTSFFERNPQLLSLAPLILDRGDPIAKQFIFTLTRSTQQSELLEALQAFALGQRGSDQERLEAYQIIAEAGFASYGKVRMWIKGQWQDLLMMNWEITEDPSTKHSPEVTFLLRQGVLTLKAGDGTEAEKLLNAALELEPNAPDLLFNLAGAYQRQGLKQEGRKLVEQIHQEHPDYAFASLSLARQYLQEKQVKKAEELLKPFSQRKKLHIQEFEQLCQAHIELALANQTPDAAQSWLRMWEQLEPDSDDLSYWQRRLKHLS